jgi:hypothetical protein
VREFLKFVKIIGESNFLILITAAVVVGLLVAYRLQRGAKEDDGCTTEDELLKDLETAYYAGKMDAAEFQRVSASLKAKMARGSEVSKPPAMMLEKAAPVEEQLDPPTADPRP